MSRHPLIGHAVRVSPGLPPRIADRSFDGIVTDAHSAGGFVVMRLDDGTVKTWGPEAVTFADPERAARVLRAHAASVEAQGLGAPEYTPPRWVNARDVSVGERAIAIAYPNGQRTAFDPFGGVWSARDRDAAKLRDGVTWLLMGEWPALPKEGA